MHFKAPLLATVYCCTRRTVCPCCIDFKIREVHTAQMHLGVISMKLTHAHVYKCNACSRLDGTREDGMSLRMEVHTYLHVHILILLNIGSVLTSSQALKIKSWKALSKLSSSYALELKSSKALKLSCSKALKYQSSHAQKLSCYKALMLQSSQALKLQRYIKIKTCTDYVVAHAPVHHLHHS